VSITIVILVLELNIFLVAVLDGLLFWLRRKCEQAMAGGTDVPRDDGVVMAERIANFFGLLSKSAGQVCADGTLVLTNHALEFLMFVSKKHFTFSLDSITRLDDPKWWLGKSVGKRLAAVYYENGQGGQNAVAFWVRDTDEYPRGISESSLKVAGPSPSGRGPT
jgi:hypothetical protein